MSPSAIAWVKKAAIVIALPFISYFQLYWGAMWGRNVVSDPQPPLYTYIPLLIIIYIFIKLDMVSMRACGKYKFLAAVGIGFNSLLFIAANLLAFQFMIHGDDVGG